ncbi:unnamed protein product [Didymodactylos carnosus]|uniref:Uncharacterized protein n=1 Tax=Didymodactylos carnosus TaxID=1234261 RepID=A0A8S2E5U8_9BILA|nr:unnamed protein product [Didymodactylos carnosus]CAF3856703.1 unnamed protein product [Didymodactylos carnosus]
MAESKQKEIVMIGMDPCALEKIVSFAYTSQIEINDDSVTAILTTAHMLQIGDIIEACCSYIKKNLHASNCIGVHKLALHLDLHDMASFALEFTWEHFDDVVKQEEFLELSSVEMKNIRDLVIRVAQAKLTVNICQTATWSLKGEIVAGGNGKGDALNQLSYPIGIFIDRSEKDGAPLYIVDMSNHRVLKYAKGASEGQIILGGQGKGGENNQLHNPHYIVVDPTDGTVFVTDTWNNRIQVLPKGSTNTPRQSIKFNYKPYGITVGGKRGEYLYVSDYDGHRVLRYEKDGCGETVVAGGQGRGSNLDQLYGPWQIYVDEDESIYIADTTNHRIMKWLKDASQGEVVAGRTMRHSSNLNDFNCPTDVFVDQQGSMYIVDYGIKRIMRWLKGTTSGTVIAGTGLDRSIPRQLDNPQGFTFDREGNLYVSSLTDNHVLMFAINKSCSG